MKEWVFPTIAFSAFEVEDILTASGNDQQLGGTFED